MLLFAYNSFMGLRVLQSFNRKNYDGGITFATSVPQQAKIKFILDTNELLVEGYAENIVDTISLSSNVEQELET